MTTLARAPGRREIAAFATLYTAGALSASRQFSTPPTIGADRRNGLVPCLASSSSTPPSGRVNPEDPAPRASGGEPPAPSSTVPSSPPLPARAQHVLELLERIEREHGPDRAAIAFLRALELSVHAIAWLPVAGRAQAYGAIAVAIELLVLYEARVDARELIVKTRELYEHLAHYSGAYDAGADAHDRLASVPWLVVTGAEWSELVDELVAIDDMDNPEHGLTAEMVVKLEDWLRDHARAATRDEQPARDAGDDAAELQISPLALVYAARFHAADCTTVSMLDLEPLRWGGGALAAAVEALDRCGDRRFAAEVLVDAALLVPDDGFQIACSEALDGGEHPPTRDLGVHLGVVVGSIWLLVVGGAREREQPSPWGQAFEALCALAGHLRDVRAFNAIAARIVERVATRAAGLEVER